ncbi:MAG: sodium:calcium antiporter [Patescibacteria group bacterium]|jgi:cation:H+ antiporter
MTTGIAIVFFLFGLLALWLGGEGVVRSVMSYARAFRVGAFVLSLTLLAAATSAPELFFNIFSSSQGSPEVGLGNVLGANITNFALIFAIATLFIPIKKRDEEAIWTYPSLFGIILFFFLLGLDGTISRFEGGMLVAVFAVWMYFAVQGEHKKNLLKRIGEILPAHRSKKEFALTTVLFITSIALLSGGAELLIRSVKHLALAWNFSAMLLAAVIIALGTTLPEFATTIVALYRKRNDIRSGTLFGSNIFNLTLIVGVAALIHPIVFSQAHFIFLGFLMIVTTALTAPILFNFKSRSQFWSILLLVTYVFFIVYIITKLTA